MLYQEIRTEKPKEEFGLSKALYVPYHPLAKILFKMLKDDFGFAVICKKTQTLGDILLKKGRKVEQQYRRNTVYYIPCKECPMKYVGQTSVPLKKRCKEHENL